MPAPTGGLRVAMLHPCYWPEVRRGTERTIHELGTRLAARGHQPTLITSHPGRREVGADDGMRVIRLPRPPDGRLRRRLWEDYVTHVPLSYVTLRAGHHDLAHAWFVTDALASARWGHATGRPAIFSYMGIPNHLGLMWKRKRLDYTLRALRECDAVVALSEFAAKEFRRWLGYDPHVIPPPVDVETFVPGPERTPEPTIICAADSREPRKRVDLLVRAFALVRRERPTARLLLNGASDPGLVLSLADERAGVELADMDDRARLAGLYASSWVSALPAQGEAFGLVLAEALACGTPVVGTDDGGITEIVDRPQIGQLFSGDERELAQALLAALDLAADPATAAACRERAQEFSAERCADAYEALYATVLAERRDR